MSRTCATVARPRNTPKDVSSIRRSVIWLPLVAAILVATSAAPAAAMALGVSIPGGRSAGQVQSALDAFTAKVGHKPALWSVVERVGEP